jgi:hypothetical protein
MFFPKEHFHNKITCFRLPAGEKNSKRCFSAQNSAQNSKITSKLHFQIFVAGIPTYRIKIVKNTIKNNFLIKNTLFLNFTFLRVFYTIFILPLKNEICLI